MANDTFNSTKRRTLKLLAGPTVGLLADIGESNFTITYRIDSGEAVIQLLVLQVSGDFHRVRAGGKSKQLDVIVANAATIVFS